MKKILLWVVMAMCLASCGSQPSEKSTQENPPTIADDTSKENDDLAQDGLLEKTMSEIKEVDHSICQKEHCVFPHEKLSELTLVGTMTGHHFQWAFLENAAGISQKVEVGCWVGDTHEKVIRIFRDSIELLDHGGQKTTLSFRG